MELRNRMVENPYKALKGKLINIQHMHSLNNLKHKHNVSSHIISMTKQNFVSLVRESQFDKEFYGLLTAVLYSFYPLHYVLCLSCLQAMCRMYICL